MSVQEFRDPERFVAGTVGEPGQRTFYLQVRDGRRVVSVALEKEQVSALAARIDDVLDSLLRRPGGEHVVPALAAPADVDREPLDAPVDEEFRADALGLLWDQDEGRIVIELDADEEDPDADLVRVSLSGARARAFAERARAVVSAGRPPCPFCALPLDPSGHICPRQNGYRRRS